jgi:hypothetical protein
MLVRNHNKYKTYFNFNTDNNNIRTKAPLTLARSSYFIHFIPHFSHGILLVFVASSSSSSSVPPASPDKGALEAGFRFRRLQWSWSNLPSAAPHAPLTSYNTPTTAISPSFANTLSIFTLPIHRCSGLCNSDPCPECARLLFECLSACLHARISLTATTTTTTTCRRARLTLTRHCRRRAA